MSTQHAVSVPGSAAGAVTAPASAALMISDTASPALHTVCQHTLCHDPGDVGAVLW